MIARTGNVGALALVLVFATACGSGANPSPTPTANPSPTPTASPSTAATLEGFSTEAFAATTDDPVPADLAAELQSILDDLAGEAGLSATIMSAHGTWSGATGTADGVRDMTVNDQFSIASSTKAVTAAQVMQLVEAGELGVIPGHVVDQHGQRRLSVE